MFMVQTVLINSPHYTQKLLNMLCCPYSYKWKEEARVLPFCLYVFPFQLWRKYNLPVLRECPVYMIFKKTLMMQF